MQARSSRASTLSATDTIDRVDEREDITRAPTDSDLAVVRLPDIGDEVAGYRIDALAGRGGMGVVYRAHHLHLERAAALKVLTADLAGNKSFRARFVREAQTAARLEHANIVPVYDAGEYDGMLYIAMKFIEGTDLGHVLDTEEKLNPERTVNLLSEVADALDTAHAAGMVHRDVKPGNILLDGVRSYLTDFGLTKRVSSRTALTAAGRTVGTAAYLAPEQIRGQEVDGRTDVYALGCVLYECLTGEVPFERDSDIAILWAHLEAEPDPPTVKVPELPKAVDEVFARALAKRRDDRFATCGELVSALTDASGAEVHSGDQTVQAAYVLLASTDASARALAQATLAEGRVALFAAGDVESALEESEIHPPQLVFVDADLPGGQALELCRRLRSEPHTTTTKIVLIAGRRSPLDRTATAEAGVDDVLVKPFSPLQLLAKVRDFIPDALAG